MIVVLGAFLGSGWLKRVGALSVFQQLHARYVCCPREVTSLRLVSRRRPFTEAESSLSFRLDLPIAKRLSEQQYHMYVAETCNSS
jgi:hypothetical protein